MGISITLPKEYVDFNLNKLNIKELPETSGVYIFYDSLNIPLYVGKTSNLRNRVGGHVSTSPFYMFAKYIRFYEVEELWQVDIVESYLIHKLLPEYNIDKTFYTDEDFATISERLNEGIRKTTERLENIKKILDDGMFAGYTEEDIISAKDQYLLVSHYLNGYNVRLRRLKVNNPK